ncbi:hypothetical protein F5B17DRAFT_146243 [Nemania serpens]|nr:hypothetical protein F5B17DRAFT_146243 [Nemania serpens]
MQLINLIAIVATLAIGSNAAAMRRDGARLAQFRVFGAKGCSALNDGFYTVDQSDAGSCKQFTSPPSVASLNLEQLKLPAADGCTVYIYTDKNCSEGKHATSVNVCNNPAAPGETWNSWEISCE